MPIDLTKPFTLQDVRKLIASTEDTKETQLRIYDNGFADLEAVTGGENRQDVLCRSETLDAGNGYCGVEAAKDSTWIDAVYRTLLRNWPKPESKVFDIYS